MKNKKGALIEEEWVFLVLNIAFFVILLMFIKMNDKAVIEQKYAKEIALLIDEAKPSTTIYLDMEDAFKNSKLKKEEIVKIDTKEKKVIVRLVDNGGYSQGYFSTAEIELKFYEQKLILIVKKNV